MTRRATPTTPAQRLPARALLALALLAGSACQRSTPPPKLRAVTEPTPGGSEAAEAATGSSPPPANACATAEARPSAGAVATFSPPTLERAGGRECTLDAPADIAAVDAGGLSILGTGAKLAFGPRGGIVVWETGDKRGQARPLGADGHPTGPAQSFSLAGSMLIRRLLAVDVGFAVVYSTFDVHTLDTHYFVQVLNPAGEACGGPVQLEVGQFFFEDASDWVAGRFLVFGGPNQGKGLQGARAIVVGIGPAGEVTQQTTDYPISAPMATRPAVAFALSPTRWAITVQVSAGPQAQSIVIDGQVMQAVNLLGQAPAEGGPAGSESLIVDGKLLPIRGTGAGTAYGMFSGANRYRIAWVIDELAVMWAGQDEDSGPASAHYGRFTLDAQLRPEGKPSAALRQAFAGLLEVSITSGFDGTTLTRLTELGAPLGEPVHLDGALADVGHDMMEAETVWSGDRFVTVYGPVVAGATRLRTVGMRCGADK